MHHTLRFYSRHRKLFLCYYMWQARWTAIPLVGRLVRYAANLYGNRSHSAYLLTTAEAEEVIDSAKRLAVGPCDCRRVFRNCDGPIEAEIMLGLDHNAFVQGQPGEYREINRGEAREILRGCHERGLIHTIIRCRKDFYAICNCCPCCCVPLRLSKRYGIGGALTRSESAVSEFRERMSSAR